MPDTSMGLRLYYEAQIPNSPNALTANIGDSSITYVIDFDDVARFYPVGVERFDISGDIRKSIQHTRGIEQLDGSFAKNYYVDVWGPSPEKIVISGIIKLPEAKEMKVIGQQDANGFITNRNMTFIQAIEMFYDFSSRPMYVKRGDKMTLFDLITNETITVSMRRKHFPMSVDKAMLIPFELEFAGLERVKT